MNYRLITAEVMDGLSQLADASIDSIVTDPPYELGFMGKKWDSSGIAYNVDVWREALRVLKPGGHLLAFGGTRTYHRMACAIEDAGFEIRDCLQWLYGSGFPKSLDVSKAVDRHLGAEPRIVGTRRVIPGVAFEQSSPYATGKSEIPITEAETAAAAAALQGWGTALKPANEPVVLARKRLIGTVAKNVLEHGTGALNIDACRLDYSNEEDKAAAAATQRSRQDPNRTAEWGFKNGDAPLSQFLQNIDKGRWPANVLLDEEAAAMVDEQSGPSTSNPNPNPNPNYKNAIFGRGMGGVVSAANQHGDSGGASRFFYTAKPDRNEREDGLDGLDGLTTDDGRRTPIDNAYLRGETKRKNHHPTVKPVSLMRWLVRLITPKGGIVLDPFFGSGTTGVAAIGEGFDFCGIDREPEYREIARRRIQNTAPLFATDISGGQGDNGEGSR